MTDPAEEAYDQLAWALSEIERLLGTIFVIREMLDNKSTRQQIITVINQELNP